MKGLYYCQPHTGLGPFIRALQISQSLVNHFDIDFLLGIPPAPFDFHSPQFHLHQLPLLFPSGCENSDKIFLERWEYLKKIITKKYAFFINDAFPFSKWANKQEIKRIANIVKLNNPNCLRICSLLDIPAIKESRIEKIKKNIDESYDLILYHADQRYFNFENTFPIFTSILPKLSYTGFVTNPKKLNKTKKNNTILVTTGGGSYGLDFLEPIAMTAEILKKYIFYFALGPSIPPEIKKKLTQIKQECGLDNIFFTEFIPNYEDYLNESLLSISPGGSTLYATIKAKTPALVYTGSHWEHKLRTEILSKNNPAIKGFAKKNLEPLFLAKCIEDLVPFAMDYPKLDINLEGSHNSLLAIQRLLKKHSMNP